MMFAQFEVTGELFFFIFFIGILFVVCILCQKSREDNEVPRPMRPSSQRLEIPGSGIPPRGRRRGAPQVADTASSPIGYGCLECGATVLDETSRFCSECGSERQRCPICQRYVAGGQDLLTCPQCDTPGHANEMVEWVENKGTCPHCGRPVRQWRLRKYPYRVSRK